VKRGLPVTIGMGVVVLACAGAFTLTSALATQDGSAAKGHALSAPVASSGGRAVRAVTRVTENGRARPAVSPVPTAAPVPAGGQHWTGKIHRFIGVAPGAPFMGAVQSFARAVGIHPAVVELYTGFKSPFPRKLAGQVVGYGSVPLIQWNPRGAPVKNIGKGMWDTYLSQFALAVKAFGHPIILSFGHEMNGSWSRWSRPFTTPWQFRRAWRRIHNIFTSHGVRNVTWSWDPSHGGTSARPWWPGSRFVDRIGIDGYFRHGQTFKEIFRRQLRIIRGFTSKPVYIAETAVARGPGQARQVVGIFHGIRRYHIAGFVWFDINRLEKWRIEHRRWAIHAFRKCTHRALSCR
jgi:glycosyl hydrolase family 26